MSDMPEHVDETAAGNVCRHCGGNVDKDGFSTGGLVKSQSGEYEPADEESEETEQHEGVEEKRHLAFADAVRRSRR